MKKTIPFGKAICYSGYRAGQNPERQFPSKEELREDLHILVKDGYSYIRMYDPNMHAERALQVIQEDKLPLRCVIGIDSFPETNNPKCPFVEQHYTDEELQAHIARNDNEIEKLIAMVKKYSDYVAAVSVGNENTPVWTAHKVSEERLIRHARRLKEELDKPVTFCEGYYEWPALGELAKELDIISVHSYPYHYGTSLDEAVAQNKSQYSDIVKLYPEHQVIITELGWSSDSTEHHRHAAIVGDEIIDLEFDPEAPKRASLPHAKRYYEEVRAWVEADHVIAFYFEAFDELWKGSSVHSSECNFGVYDNDRKRKL